MMRPVFKDGALIYAFCIQSNIKLRITLYSLYMLCSRVRVHSGSKRYKIAASEKTGKITFYQQKSQLLANFKHLINDEITKCTFF